MRVSTSLSYMIYDSNISFCEFYLASDAINYSIVVYILDAKLAIS